MNDKKRQTKSWKTEAEKLEGLLVQACKLLTDPFCDVDNGTPVAADIGDAPELVSWWTKHCTTSEQRKQERAAAGLAKLSAVERDALGL